MTSEIPIFAFKIPGINDQTPPAKNPPNKQSGIRIPFGKLGNANARAVIVTAPI